MTMKVPYVWWTVGGDVIKDVTGGEIPIEFNTFELGVRIGDGWWFVGDRVQNPLGQTGTIIFPEGAFLIEFDEFKAKNGLIPSTRQPLSSWTPPYTSTPVEVIGTLHDRGVPA